MGTGCKAVMTSSRGVGDRPAMRGLLADRSCGRPSGGRRRWIGITLRCVYCWFAWIAAAQSGVPGKEPCVFFSALDREGASGSDLLRTPPSGFPECPDARSLRRSPSVSNRLLEVFSINTELFRFSLPQWLSRIVELRYLLSLIKWFTQRLTSAMFP